MSIVVLQKLIAGFLTGLEKAGMSHNTIRNYRSDLESFRRFLEEQKADFQKLGLDELNHYHEELKRQGLRPNSRRRKLMTAKTFLKTVSHDIDVSLVGAEKVIPPDKVEKPPKLVEHALLDSIRSEQPSSDLGVRNRALLGVLLDTGALVTEVLALRRQDVNFDASGSASVKISGPRARRSQVTQRTATELHALIERARSGQKYLFQGYHRGGPLPGKLTPRGVEVLFKSWAKATGEENLKPRVLRHMYIADALRAGVSESEIMERLGLRTGYVFKNYYPLLEGQSESIDIKSSSGATSSSDKTSEKPAKTTPGP